MKNRKVIAILFTLVIFAIGVLYNVNTKKVDSEYSTELEPIISRFANLSNIESCYWKSGRVSKKLLSIGPTDIWFKGYIVLGNDEGIGLANSYKWEDVTEYDEKGNPKWGEYGEILSPEVTGFTNFEWKYSKEFSEYVKIDQMMGEYYFDVKNNIVYFDLSSY